MLGNGEVGFVGAEAQGEGKGPGVVVVVVSVVLGGPRDLTGGGSSCGHLFSQLLVPAHVLSMLLLLL